LIPLEKLYSPNISTVYSLEFLGQSGDPEKLGAALAANGSLGNSPATTAYYLSLCNQEDQRALDYLETVRSHMKHVIPVYPFRIFELTWVLYNLSFSGIPVTHFVDEEIWIELQSELGPFGVGSDSTFIPDGDTTSVTCRLLSEAGYEVDPAILKYYEDQTRGIFRTYSYERNISISTNVHVLDALDFIENYPNRNNLKEQIIVMLLDNRKYNMYWTDKWHASPYYTTSHALMTMLKEEGSYLAHACQHTIEWLLHTQRPDGSWGFFECGTPEETAYVLMTLVHYNSYENVGREAIHKGAAYLMQTYGSLLENSSPLWIVKCLFFPYEIVKSAVLAALILYEQVLR
jgi:halimadienyl-diphosphate synthase